MIKIETLMGFDVSGEGISSDPNPSEDPEDPRSRRRRSVWDEEEEEDW